MSILKSTTSGQALIKPQAVDFMNAGFYLNASKKQYMYRGSNSLTLDVELDFEDDVYKFRTYFIKQAICNVWKDGIEYRMYVTTHKELALVVNYFRLLYYNSTSDEAVMQLELVRNRIIEIAKKQWKEYKERRFTN